jgi:superfamily II DNA/RNA helicase
MRELESKNIIVDLQSQKKTWDDMNVPSAVKEVLDELKMHKPSVIQAKAIPMIMDD